MKFKGLYFADVAEIQEAVTDELKKVQKRNFWQLFQKLYNHTKAYIYIYIYIYMQMELILNIKRCVFLKCIQSLKKSVLKLLDCTVYVLVPLLLSTVFPWSASFLKAME